MPNQNLQSLQAEVFDFFPAFVFVVSIKDDKVLYANREARLVFGEDMVGKRSSEFMSKPDKTAPYDNVGVEFESKIKDMRYHITDFEAAWSDGETVRMVVGMDATTISAPEKRFGIAAQQDMMTGIYNRQTGVELLEQFVQEAKYMGLACSVCYIDLNDLKIVNDNYGREKGDEYIMAFVKSAKSSIRRSDAFVRMGGDEFLLIFPNCRREVSENIISIISNKLEIDSADQPVLYSFSYGLLEIEGGPTADTTTEKVLKTVEDKMLKMKAEYRNAEAFLDTAEKE